MITSHARSPKKPRSRDILDFIKIRSAVGIDDEDVGDLLVRAFSETNAEKLPWAIPSEARLEELRDVKSRRDSGQVVVLELGYRIIGTFALIRPGTRVSDSWLPNSATLRCVAIDPEFHGLGFSSALLAESEVLARSWDINHICLHVQQGAHGVARLYQERGYVRDPRGDLLAYGLPIEAYAFRLRDAEAGGGVAAHA